MVINITWLCTSFASLGTVQQDIAGFLEEHSAEVTEDERQAINEAVSLATHSRYSALLTVLNGREVIAWQM